MCRLRALPIREDLKDPNKRKTKEKNIARRLRLGGQPVKTAARGSAKVTSRFSEIGAQNNASNLSPYDTTIQTNVFVFAQRPQASRLAQRTTPSPPKGSAQPTRMNYNTSYGPRSNSCCNEGPQAGTPETWPPAPPPLAAGLRQCGLYTVQYTA